MKPVHALALCASLCGPLCAGSAVAGSDQIAVVVHPEVPVNDLSLIELRKLFLGDRRFWPSGEPVTLLIRNPPARERAVLLDIVYEMSEAQYKQYWIAKVFRTEAAASPKPVPSAELALRLVGTIPGAITLARPRDAQAAGLKVVRIDGRSPGDPGYPLH